VKFNDCPSYLPNDNFKKTHAFEHKACKVKQVIRIC
jgi:hypothetical protein